MEEKYVTDSFSFESRESYEQAKKEAEIIQQLTEKADLSDPKTALKIYNKMVSDRVFSTLTGYFFLMDLKKTICDSGLVKEKALKPIPVRETAAKRRDIIREPSAKENKYHKLLEKQQLLNKKLKIALAAAIIILIGFVVINFRFEYSIFTYFTNYKANMENELIDKYESWEEDLQKREDQLNK